MSGVHQILLGGSQAPAVDPFFYSVTSLLHGDGTNGGQNNTFLDSSSNNFTITRNGNTTQGSFSPFSQTGWGNYFDGSGDYLQLPSNAALSFGTGNFTLECFVYLNAQKDYNALFDSRASDGDTGGFAFGVTSSGAVYLYTSSFRISAGTVPTSAWTHVALVNNSGTLTAYINGTSIGTWAGSPNFSNSTGRVGSDWANLYSTNGFISNFRLVKGTAVYTSNFTPSLTPLTAISGTSLLTCQANRFLDASTNNFTITRNGDVSVQPFSPFNPITPYSTSSVGGSGYFDGSGDWITTPNVSAFDLSSSSVDFTIEAWVYNSNTAVSGIIGARQNAQGQGWCLYIQTNNTLYMGSVIVGNSYADRQMNTTVIPPNTWAHVALVKTSSGYTAYVNGVGGTLLALTGGLQYQSTQPVIVGALGSQGELPFRGYITNARIVKGTAVYTSNFTPPTAPLTAITNTSYLLNFTNGAIFDNAAVADYETVGNAQISTSVKKYGTGSIAFDGTGDYLVTDAPSTQLMTFGTGDFTIEFWLYVVAFPSAGTYKIIYDSRPNSTQGLYPTITLKGSTIVYYTNSADRIASGSISATTWYHVALCRTASQTKLFINGTQVGSTYADTNSYINVASRPLIGDSGFAPSSTDGLNGYIDDLRISKGVGRYQYNFTPPTAEFPNIGGTVTLTADPYFDYTTLLLPGNGTNGAQNNTFLDSSTNNFTITRNGNTTQGTFSPFSQTGWGNYFDGTGDYLSVPYSAATTEWWTQDFTIEMWVYNAANKQSGINAVPLQISHGDAAAAATYWAFGTVATGQVQFYYFNGSGVALTSTDVAPLNAWNHIAMVYTHSTANISLYLNGVRVLSTTKSGTPQNSASYPVNIGISQGVSYNGYISNLRVLDGTAAYSGTTYTVPTTPLTAITNTSLLTCQSNRFRDASTNNFTITRNGDVSVQAFSPFNPTAAWSASTNGGSGYFDGSGDFLQVADAAPMELGSGNWTIEMWVNTTNSTAYSALFTRDDGVTTAGSYVILLNGATANGIVSFYSADINAFSAPVLTSGTTSCRDGAWHHIAIVRNSNTLTMYIDGTSTSTATFSGSFANTAQPIKIGSETGYSRDYTGYISNVRLVVGTAVYTANFTPPTAPLTAITNTQLLLNYTNAGIYDATAKNDLETVGNAQISTTQSKFGGSSMAFDGSGDYLLGPWNPLTDLGAGDFTIEFWMYPTAGGQSSLSYLFNLATNANFGAILIAQSVSGYGIVLYASSTGSSWNLASGSSFGTATQNAWNHIALTRYGADVRLFVNGVLGTTLNWGTTALLTGSSYRPNIGSGGGVANTFYTGYMQDVRVTKGIARYTSNFTPPTTAFLTL